MNTVMGYVVLALLFIFMNNFLNPCYALTPYQIVKVRKRGVSDKIIQMMLEHERDARQDNPSDQIGAREVKDKEGKVGKIYPAGRSTRESAGDADEAKVEKAWKMSQKQNMIIDDRK